MQRLFSIFPASAPGVALILSRACVAALFAADAWTRCPAAGTDAWCAAAGALATLLTLGLMTPLACVLCLVCETAFAFQHPTLLTAVALVQAVAVGLLGPGAYSLDGLLFGRRRMVWPRARG